MFFLPIRSSCAATTQISPCRFENIYNRRKYLIFRSFGNPVFPLFSTVSPQIFPCFQQLFPQCYPHYPIFSAFERERSPSLFPSGSAGLHAFRAVVFSLFCTGCPQVFPHCPQVFHKFSPFIAKPGDVQRLRVFLSTISNSCHRAYSGYSCLRCRPQKAPRPSDKRAPRHTSTCRKCRRRCGHNSYTPRR